ncbi:MAG TPA: hypothetical protein VGA05_09265 [Candidatus Bathyarchaeia archaeon]
MFQLGLGRIKGIGVAQSSDYHVDLSVAPIANARRWLADLSRLTGGDSAKKIRVASVDAQPDLQD